MGTFSEESSRQGISFSPRSNQKITVVGGTKLSFKHTSGSDTPSCHQNGLRSMHWSVCLPGTNTVPTQHCWAPGKDAPSHPSMALHSGPYPSPHTIWHGLTSSPTIKLGPRFWTSCFLLFSSHWQQGTLDQTLGSLAETGHIAQSTSHSSKETLGVSSDRPARNKGEVPANVQEVVNWSCPFWYLWRVQKVAAGYFALKSHQERRSMLSSHLLISFQNSIQKMWH